METFFNLDSPIEQTIYESLLEYTEMDMTPDQVLSRLGKEFPFMSDDLRRKCEDAVFKDYEGDENEDVAAEFKQMVLLHSSVTDYPFYSHIGSSFRLSENQEDDVYISIMVENKRFKHGQAQVHYIIYVDDVQVGEIDESLSDMDRRKIYTLPLHILDKGLMEGSLHKSFKVRVEDRNTEGKEYRSTIDVFHGEATVEEAFDPFYWSITFEDDEPDTDIDGYRYENWLRFRANVLYNEKTYGNLQELQATVSLVPTDPDMQDFTYTYPLYMVERYDCPNDICIDCRIPTDKIHPGDYTLLVEIWDDLLFADFVTIDDPIAEDDEPEVQATEYDPTLASDDFDKLLDDYIKSVLEASKIGAAIQFQLLDDEINVVSTEAGKFIRILKEPTKIRTRIQFPGDWENEEDIQIMARGIGWHYPIRFTITGKEFNEIKGKTFERDFLLGRRELQNFKLLYMEMKTADGSKSGSFDYTVVRFDSPQEILDLQSLCLYNSDSTSKVDALDEPSKTVFKPEELETLSAYCRFTNVHDLNFAGTPTEMVWNLYSDTGVLLESVNSQLRYTETIDAVARFGEFNDYVWEKGEYRLELTWFGETVFSATFKVGF